MMVAMMTTPVRMAALMTMAASEAPFSGTWYFKSPTYSFDID